MTKSELSLNPDFYSADVYVAQEESQKPMYIRAFMQLFMVFIVFGILVFSYKYFMKNYYEEVHLWVMERKIDFLAEKVSVPLVIREELVSSKVENEKIVQMIHVPKVKPQMIQDEELTDEYIKLVEQSLGNY